MLNVSSDAQTNGLRQLFLIDDDTAFIDINGRIVISASDPKLIDQVRQAAKSSEVFRQNDWQHPWLRFNEFSEGLAVIGWALCPMCRNPFWVNGIIDQTGRLHSATDCAHSLR